jgi:hypothetical protein
VGEADARIWNPSASQSLLLAKTATSNQHLLSPAKGCHLEVGESNVGEVDGHQGHYDVFILYLCSLWLGLEVPKIDNNLHRTLILPNTNNKQRIPL